MRLRVDPPIYHDRVKPQIPFDPPDVRRITLHDCRKKGWEEVERFDEAGGAVSVDVVAHGVRTNLRETFPLTRSPDHEAT